METNDFKFESLDELEEKKSRGTSRAKTGKSLDPKMILCAIAAVIIIIVLIFVFSAQKKAKDAERASIAEQESIAESIAASEAAEEAKLAAYSHVTFAPCEIPELNQLAEDYFAARLSCDSSRLFEIFGRNDTTADADLEKKLKAQADWIQKFQDIHVSTVDGLSDNDKLCIIQYTIDFRRTDTMAPGVMYFYAERRDDGSYRFVETPVKEVHDFIEGALSSPSARAIIDASNAELKENLDNNSTLALIYTSFLSGEIYKESSIDVDKEQEVDLFIDPNASILVGQDVLDKIEQEAAEEAAMQASLAEEDEN